MEFANRKLPIFCTSPRVYIELYIIRIRLLVPITMCLVMHGFETRVASLSQNRQIISDNILANVLHIQILFLNFISKK